MVVGPNFVVKSYPRFCTRGYAFTTQKRRRSSTTYDAGVCSASGDDVYYGHIHEILEIKYLGMVGLRCTVFYCDWHDNTLDRGVRTDAFGVTSVNSRRKLQYYDPFILASQADQVCYIKYPRVRNIDDLWVTVTRLNPKGRVQGSYVLEDPLQPSTSGNLSAAEDLAGVGLVVDLTDFGEEAVVHKRRRSSTTYDAGVCSASGDDVYYGHIHEILEIKYLGMVGLRCTVFYCDWHDNTLDRGVRTDAFGVTSVNSRRKLQYYDPFILASQADQVCYIKYLRVRNRDDPWVTVTRLNPRDRVQESSELEDPLQPSTSGNLSAAEDLAGVGLVVDLTDLEEEAVVHVEDEPVIGEFHQDPDSDSSVYFLGKFRRNSKEDKGFLGIPSVEPDFLPRFSFPLSPPNPSYAEALRLSRLLSASRSLSLAIPLRSRSLSLAIPLRLTLSLSRLLSASRRPPPLSLAIRPQFQSLIMYEPYPTLLGYAFTTQKRRRSSTTYDAGVCSASGDDVYYGHIHEILEIKYLGMVGLRSEDLVGVGLVVDLTDFGEEAVVHVEDEPVIGEFHQDPDSDSSGDDDSETD
ncbi:hypothetical protein DY000_02051938 [Brassica cretica]|uniref:DUF4216 domain-containing protein n=1 Tax=Brassica cretica TaxID=69181 RepID=A0ABQ7AC66_BRACR|nr:hypothetical protein DY000_02051938 [Brassica cretica]